MNAALSARLAGTAGAVSLALLSAALITFPVFPTTGAALSTQSPPVSVNRALKGDRLPTERSDQSGSPVRTLPQARVPFGCEAAFSPISSPLLASIFRRCMV